MSRLTGIGRYKGIIGEILAARRFARGYARAAPAFMALNIVVQLADAACVGLTILLLKVALGSTAAISDEDGPLADFARDVFALLPAHVVPLALAIVAVTLLRLGADILLGLLDSRIYSRMSHAVRCEIHAQYMDVAYAYMAGRDQAYLLNVLEREAEHVPELFQTLKNMSLDAAAVLIFGSLLLLTSWQVSAMALAGGAALVLCLRLASRRIERFGAISIRRRQSMVQRILIGLQSLRTLKAFAQEPLQDHRFRAVSGKVCESDYRMDRLQTFIDPVGEIGQLLVVALLLLAALPLGVSLTALVASLALLYRMQPHLGSLMSGVISVVGKAPHLALVRTVLDRSDKPYPPVGHGAFARFRREIRFEGVSFRYPGAQRDSLRAVDLSLPRGEVTALVGPSGSGKSTLVNLLFRLYEPTGGRILADGTGLATLDRTQWLERIALAGQDVDLVEGTIANNIRLSRPDASLAEVRRAAKTACALEFIDELPDGLSAWVGERGLRLSGGQRQRIGLARALLRRPEILVLDEATSAVDETTERQIRANIERDMPELTLVLITHRLHMLDGATQVIRLQGGQVEAAASETTGHHGAQAPFYVHAVSS